MKKWILHSISAVTNAVAVISLLVYSFYGWVKESAYQLTFIFVLLGSIYLLNDVWALKLLHKYNQKVNLSIIQSRLTSVLMFGVILIEIGIGLLSFELLSIHIFRNYTFSHRYIDEEGIFSIVLTIIFISASIVLITTPFLLKAIKKNQLAIKKEIEHIGKVDS